MVHTGGRDVPIRVDPSSLSFATYLGLSTPAKVRTACEAKVIRFLIRCGILHMDNHLKHDFDIVPDALNWFVRHPSIRINKNFVAILQFAATGTIQRYCVELNDEVIEKDEERHPVQLWGPMLRGTRETKKIVRT
jgi:hypothetical protein